MHNRSTTKRTLLIVVVCGGIPTIALLLFAGLVVPSPRFSSLIEASLISRYTPDLSRELLSFGPNGETSEKISLSKEPDVKMPLLSSVVQTVTATAKARSMKVISKSTYDPKNDRLNVEFLTAQLPGLGSWNLKGSLTKVFSGNPDLNLTVKGTDIPLGKAKVRIASYGLEGLKAIVIDGQGEADLRVTGKMTSPSVQGMLYAKGSRLRVGAAELESFVAEARVDHHGNATSIRDAVFKTPAVDFASPKEKGLTGRLNDLELRVPLLERKDRMIDAPGLHLKAEGARVRAGGKAYSTESGISVLGDLTGDLEEGRVRFGDFSLDLGVLKGISGSLSFERGSPMTAEARIEHPGIDLEEIAPGWLPFFPAARQWGIKGKARIGSFWRARLAEGSPAQMAGRIEVGLTEGGFSSADGTTVAEGIAMKVASSFVMEPPAKRTELKLEVEAGEFELLVGKFYGDFKDRKVSLSLEGESLDGADTFRVSQANLSLTDVGALLISGEVGRLAGAFSFDGRVRLTNLSNQEAYDLFIRETFQESFPFLSKLTMDGTTRASIAATGSPDRLRMHGEIQVLDMNVRGEELGLELAGINLSLPIELSYPRNAALPYRDAASTGRRDGLSAPAHRLERAPGNGGPPAASTSLPGLSDKPGDPQGPVAGKTLSPKVRADPKEPRSFGSLKVQRLSWGALTMQDVEAFPVVRRNALFFREDIVLPVFGGRVVFGNVSYQNLLGPVRTLLLSIDVDGVDLAEVSAGLGIPRLSGSLTGAIPQVSFTGSRLLTEGEMVLRLFGGEMRVKEISVENVLSPIASLGSSVELEEIDLGRLTDAFEFGHISGIVEGYVRDLVITRGQPERFVARIETVKRRGVSQRISMEALEKISILGTGASTSILSRGLYRLFKSYRYAKMGFQCRLKNDNFVLVGIEVEGDKGYLVKAGLLPPKVNVINYTQNISFREMLKRLKRIGGAGKGEVTMGD